MKLLDFSYARPTPEKIKSEGFDGVLRYLFIHTRKNLSIQERDSYLNAGLGIGLVWETTANRSLSGVNGGMADAKEALRQADVLEYHGAIFFAVDFDASQEDQALINDYLNGAKTILGDRVGLYAGYWVIKRAFDAGIIKWGWQTYAWSGGNRDPRAQIYQYSNGEWNDSVDFNETNTNNWGGQFKGGTMEVGYSEENVRKIFKSAFWGMRLLLLGKVDEVGLAADIDNRMKQTATGNVDAVKDQFNDYMKASDQKWMKKSDCAKAIKDAQTEADKKLEFQIQADKEACDGQIQTALIGMVQEATVPALCEDQGFIKKEDCDKVTIVKYYLVDWDKVVAWWNNRKKKQG